MDLSTALILRLHVFRNNFEAFFEEVVPVSKECKLDIPQAASVSTPVVSTTKTSKRNKAKTAGVSTNSNNSSTQQAYNEKLKPFFFETIDLYIKEISNRFES